MSSIEILRGQYRTIGTNDFYKETTNIIGAGYTETKKFVNQSNHRIYISRRDGIVAPIEKNLNYSGINKLTVYSSLTIQESVKNDCRALSSVVKNNDRLIRDFNESVDEGTRYNLGGGIDFYYALDIDLSVLESLGGCAYFPELDCVITIKGMAEPQPHPYSEFEIAKRALLQDDSVRGGAVYQSVLLVDNEGNYGKKWMKFGDKVAAIAPVKITGLRDGVYVYMSHSGETLRLEAEDFITFGIFHTIKDLEDFDRKNETAKLELNAAAEKAKVKVIENKLATDKAVREDHFDRRSTERKEGSEVLKMIPAVIVGLGAIFMALKTFKLF